MIVLAVISGVAGFFVIVLLFTVPPFIAPFLGTLFLALIGLTLAFSLGAWRLERGPVVRRSVPPPELMHLRTRLDDKGRLIAHEYLDGDGNVIGHG